MANHGGDAAVGVAVSKTHLDAWRADGWAKRFGNDAKGFEDFAAWVVPADALGVYESTGPLPLRLQGDAGWPALCSEVLASIPGLGPVTVAGLIVNMPELGRLDAKAAASLAGVAPMARESGNWKGRSRIQGRPRTGAAASLHGGAERHPLQSRPGRQAPAAGRRRQAGEGRPGGRHAQAAPARQRPAPRRPALDAQIGRPAQDAAAGSDRGRRPSASNSSLKSAKVEQLEA